MLTRRYIELVLRHRILVLVLFALVSAAAGYSISRGVFASSIIRLFLGNSPDFYRYRELANRFSDNDLMVVAFEEPQLFTPEGWQRLERITRQLDELAFIKRVDSLSVATRIRGSADELDVRSYSEVVAATGDYAALRRELLADEIVAGLLISHQGRATAVMLEFVPDDDRPIEELPALLAQIYAIFAQEGVPPDRLHPAGMVPESVEATNQAVYSLLVILPVTVLVLVVLVFVLFRQVWPVVLTTGVAILSIIWTFGFAILWDRQINIMMAMVPAVMVIVAFSDIIHLCSAYLLELKAGQKKSAAILKVGTEVGQACFYTSLTTLVGFAAIAFVPTPIFRLTGIVLGTGVAIALLLALTLVPIFLTYLPVPDVSRHGHGLGMRIIARISNSCLRFSTARPWLTVAVFAAAALIAISGSLQIEVETSMVDRLQPDNPIQVSRRFVQENFAGTNFLDLYLSLPGEGSGFVDSAHYAALAELQQRVTAIADVDRAHSLVDLIAAIHREMLASEGQPRSTALLAQYLLLFEMSGGEGLERLVDEERQTTRMTVRLTGSGLVRTAAIGQQAANLARELFGPQVEVLAGGLPALFGAWIDDIIAGQRRGLLFALVATTLMMIVSLRLVGAGLVAMIPNALPILTLGGFCGWAWDTSDSDTMLIAMIAIGIAVDDTVHFTTRLRLEVQKSGDLDGALAETFRFTGAAIVKTTVILVGGFLPFVTSDYFTTRIMGYLLPGTLVVALVADLLLLPALIRIGILRLPTADPGESQRLLAPGTRESVESSGAIGQ